MHALFLEGWNHQITGNIASAIKCYEGAIELKDQCAVFNWNCMDRYGQGIPVNINNDCDLEKLSLTNEEFDLLLTCYQSDNTVESRFNLGRLFSSRKDYEKSFKQYFLSATNDAYPPAQYCVGWAHQYGYGVSKNIEMALHWYTLAADNGWHISFIGLGCYYYNSRPKNLELAHKWFSKGLVLKCKHSQCNLGLIHYERKEYREAESLFILSATQGNLFACRQLYELYNGPLKDPIQAIHYLTMVAQSGEHKAQEELSTIYLNGRGVPIDLNEALKWLTMAVESNHHIIQCNLAMLYVKMKNYNQAHKWFLASANQGNESGRVNVGLLYLRGQGVAQDFVEARKWLELVPENSWAQGELAMLYMLGRGVPPDPIKGHYLLYLSATKGFEYAQCDLGSFYYKGTTRNEAEALKWWTLASTQGTLEAQYRLGKHYYKNKDYTQSHKYITLAVNNPGPDQQSKFFPKAHKMLIMLDDLHNQIQSQLNRYISKGNNEGPSYLFFCNFINYLIHQTPNVNHHNSLYRLWIIEKIQKYFKQMGHNIPTTTLNDWFIELFGE